MAWSCYFQTEWFAEVDRRFDMVWYRFDMVTWPETMISRVRNRGPGRIDQFQGGVRLGQFLGYVEIGPNPGADEVTSWKFTPCHIPFHVNSSMGSNPNLEICHDPFHDPQTDPNRPLTFSGGGGV